jgi:hypothetical protein
VLIPDQPAATAAAAAAAATAAVGCSADRKRLVPLLHCLSNVAVHVGGSSLCAQAATIILGTGKL